MNSLNVTHSRYYLPNTQQEGGLFKSFQFGSGENHVQILPPALSSQHVDIMFRYAGDHSIMQLLLLTDALRRQGATSIDLFVPYFPGARQDRLCNPGEALSVKVYADVINQQRYRKIFVFDPHSDVVAAVLDHVQVSKNHQLVEDVLAEIGRDIMLVSPDAGSNKKIFELSTKLGGVPIIRADKLRDVRNGAIISTEVFCGDLSGKTCVIVDDICAGGRTFVELAIQLKAKNCEKIVLVVSHYEGSAKEQRLVDSGIHAVYTTNSVKDLIETDFLHVKNIWQYMPANGESK